MCGELEEEDKEEEEVEEKEARVRMLSSSPTEEGGVMSRMTK